ncbi:MAG: ribbon-helix-helix domain-containing protein [Acidobacteria bacterium]|nr:ribbon-helix-helix domain-containing protein [Acidobacteriota bacterium]
MPATRTQVYLQLHQRQRLDEIAGSRGLSLASVVREAVDRYIAEAPVDPTTALESTFGAAPEAQVPGRDDWAVRSDRLKAIE